MMSTVLRRRSVPKKYRLYSNIAPPEVNDQPRTINDGASTASPGWWRRGASSSVDLRRGGGSVVVDDGGGS